jgi:hypothetical protein
MNPPSFEAFESTQYERRGSSEASVGLNLFQTPGAGDDGARQGSGDDSAPAQDGAPADGAPPAQGEPAAPQGQEGAPAPGTSQGDGAPQGQQEMPEEGMPPADGAEEKPEAAADARGELGAALSALLAAGLPLRRGAQWRPSGRAAATPGRSAAEWPRGAQATHQSAEQAPRRVSRFKINWGSSGDDRRG